MNNFKTFLLMLFLAGLLGLIGELIGGHTWMIIFVLIAVVINFAQYWYSDKLAIKMAGAYPVTASTHPRMARIVYKLCDEANIPHPDLYVIPQPMPNAFATGRDPSHAAVAATEGLLNLMSDEELEGVLAHELAHVKNRDILLSTIAASIAMAILIISRVAFWFGGRDRDNPLGIIGLLLMMILAPLAAMLIQMAISRSREFQADRIGGEISGNPLGLARALAKLDNYHRRPHHPYASQGNAHMFIYSPLNAKQSLANIFSTHPPIPVRIEKLEKQAEAMR